MHLFYCRFADVYERLRLLYGERMRYLKFFRELVRDILTYGTIITIVFVAIIKTVVHDLDLATFFAVSLTVCYFITGMTAGLFRCIDSLNLSRRTAFLCYIPASITGTLGGVFLAQSVIRRLFDRAVLFRGVGDLLSFIIIGLIVSGFVILFDYLNSARKEKQRLLEKEKERAAGLEILHRDATIQTLQSRLNPHFLFNILNSIDSLACVSVAGYGVHSSKIITISAPSFR